MENKDEKNHYNEDNIEEETAGHDSETCYNEDKVEGETAVLNSECSSSTSVIFMLQKKSCLVK